MKKIFQAASSIFAVIPGIAILRSGVGVPPDYKVIYGGLIEAIGIFSLLSLWVNRSKIKSMEKAKVHKISSAFMFLFLIALFAHLFVFNYCVVEDVDRGTVVFPLWESGGLSYVTSEAGSRQEAIRQYGRDRIIMLIDAMPLARTATLIIILIIYQAIFTSLVIAFGLLAIYIREEP